MSISRCIYCLEEKPLPDFNKEHVLHEAFGGFQGALTLAEPGDPRVCRACNDHFGRSIDLVLTRDSVEALLRLHTGLKSAAEVGDLFHRRVKFQLPEDHRFGPLYLEIIPDKRSDRIQVVPFSQARFSRVSGGFKCFTEAQLRDNDPRADPDIEIKRYALFWSSRDEMAKDRLIELLNRYDIRFVPESPIEFPKEEEEFLTEITWAIDRSITRAIAKIGMNYLAKISGPVDRELVFSSSFDGVRRFIRYGEGNIQDFVRTKMPTSLPSGTPWEKLSHVIAVKWDARILGFVQLFSCASYIVRLSDRPPQIWLNLDSAHKYDLATERVSRAPTGRSYGQCEDCVREREPDRFGLVVESAALGTAFSEQSECRQSFNAFAATERACAGQSRRTT